MEEEVELEREKYKNYSLYNCDKLLSDIGRDRDETQRMFSGDLRMAYFAAIDRVASKVRNVRMKIRNL